MDGGLDSPRNVVGFDSAISIPLQARKFNRKLNDKSKLLWYSTVRNQEQHFTERMQTHEEQFFRYLLYE